MAKPSRKVQAKSKAASKPKAKPKAVRKPSKAKPAAAAPKGGPTLGGKGPAGMAARLAAMAAASREVEETEVKPSASNQGAGGTVGKAAPSAALAGNGHAPGAAPSAAAAKKGSVVIMDDDPLEDDGGPMVVSKSAGKTTSTAVDDGVSVVAKKAVAFSDDLLAELKRSIVVKGGGKVIAGINLDELKYNEEGLIPVIAQDRRTGAVLMQAWATKEAVEKSLTSKEMTYWSRQRNKLWTKGEESGHSQKLVHMAVDCDKDSLLAIVEQKGPACHNDTGTCWTAGKTPPVASFLGELDRIIGSRAREKPKGSYTVTLLEDPKKAAAKVLEEAEEFAKVVQGKPNPDSLEHEAADLIYHSLVAMHARGSSLESILEELIKRAAKS